MAHRRWKRSLPPIFSLNRSAASLVSTTNSGSLFTAVSGKICRATCAVNTVRVHCVHCDRYTRRLGDLFRCKIVHRVLLAATRAFSRLFIVPAAKYNPPFSLRRDGSPDRFAGQIRTRRKTRADRTRPGRAFYKLFYNPRLTAR